MPNTIEHNNAPSSPVASPILVMHQRYETAHAELCRLDQVKSRAPEHLASYRGAINDLLAEQDTLRRAILRQTPDLREEFAVMLFHASKSYDLIADSQGEAWDESEGEALRIAMQHLFDFAVCDYAADVLDTGHAFTIEAGRVSRLRRLRTGDVEA